MESTTSTASREASSQWLAIFGPPTEKTIMDYPRIFEGDFKKFESMFTLHPSGIYTIENSTIKNQHYHPDGKTLYECRHRTCFEMNTNTGEYSYRSVMEPRPRADGPMIIDCLPGEEKELEQGATKLAKESKIDLSRHGHMILVRADFEIKNDHFHRMGDVMRITCQDPRCHGKTIATYGKIKPGKTTTMVGDGLDLLQKTYSEPDSPDAASMADDDDMSSD